MTSVSPEDPSFKSVSKTLLITSTTNPRKHYAKEDMAALVKSVNDNGVMEPLLVREHPTEPGKFEIIAGERRYRAALKSKWPAVPCRILNVDDNKALIIQADENLNRVNLNPLEEAATYQNLMKAGLKQEQIAEKYKCNQSQISNRLRLLKLPKVWQKKLITGAVPVTFARELAAWVDFKQIFDRLERRIECQQSHLAPGQLLELADLRDILAESICDISQPVEDAAPLILTPKLKKQLQVKKLPENLFKPGTERIFGDVWELRRLVEEAEAEAEEETTEPPKEAAPEPPGPQSLFDDETDVEPEEAPPERTPEEIQANVNHAQEVADRNKGSKFDSPGQRKKYAPYKLEWIQSQVIDHIEKSTWEQLAQEMGIRVDTHWKLDEPFLKLHTRKQLLALAKEWGFDVKQLAEYQNDQAIIEAILIMDRQCRIQFDRGEEKHQPVRAPLALVRCEINK